MVWTFESIVGSPIVITVPHDRGFHPHDLLGLFKERGKGVKGRDIHIWPIVKDILLEVRVNAVRGLFPRHFIDYNRSLEGINYYPVSNGEPQTALDDERLKPFYNHYHQQIANFLERTIRLYREKGCVLLDFHGFSKQPAYGDYDLIFGTGNRITVKSDVDKALANFLLTRGYRVFLPAQETLGQLEDMYSADYTVRHYAEKFDIDAIQIEVAKSFRVLEGKKIGRKLSADVAEFLRLYFDL